MDNEQLIVNMEGSYVGTPFASPTEEAVGEYFIGRRSALSEMHKYVIDSDKIHNYHVVGLPRIGKSSFLAAFKEMVLRNHYNHKLIVVSISLDACKDIESVWSQIGKGLCRELRRNYKSTSEYGTFVEEMEFEGVDDNRVDYEYVCSVARSMKTAGFTGLVLIDEFDSFSIIATKGSVGQFRTLFAGHDFAIRAVIASRRMIERIEREVEGAVNANVSILAGVFVNGVKLKQFNDEEMNEYWMAVKERLGHSVSAKYIQEVKYYCGNHPYLLNLLNASLWAEQEKHDYIYDENVCLSLKTDLVYKLYDAFNWAVWRDMEKWNLLRSLILSTWGPDMNIPKDELSELVRYDIIDESQVLMEPDGPIRLAISRYFTEWMNLQRYVLPFGDEWSKAEGNMRHLVKCFCDDMYGGNEEKMVKHLSTKHVATYDLNVDPRYSAKGRFDAMQFKMAKNINKYPEMSSSVIDYSDPSDLPEIFFKREWQWFEQVFGETWRDWSAKFATMNEIRNIRLHNNEGVPQTRIDTATKYCHEVNEKVEAFLKNR